MALGNMLAASRSPARTPVERAMYDGCLVHRNENITACDAMLRVYARELAQEAVLKVQAKRMIAAGKSKREVVEWGFAHQLYGGALTEAVGISQRDLQTGNY